MFVPPAFGRELHDAVVDRVGDEDVAGRLVDGDTHRAVQHARAVARVAGAVLHRSTSLVATSQTTTRSFCVSVIHAVRSDWRIAIERGQVNWDGPVPAEPRFGDERAVRAHDLQPVELRVRGPDVAGRLVDVEVARPVVLPVARSRACRSGSRSCRSGSSGRTGGGSMSITSTTPVESTARPRGSWNTCVSVVGGMPEPIVWAYVQPVACGASARSSSPTGRRPTRRRSRRARGDTRRSVYRVPGVRRLPAVPNFPTNVPSSRNTCTRLFSRVGDVEELHAEHRVDRRRHAVRRAELPVRRAGRAELERGTCRRARTR